MLLSPGQCLGIRGVAGLGPVLTSSIVIIIVVIIVTIYFVFIVIFTIGIFIIIVIIVFKACIKCMNLSNNMA